jgi:hypothetical protein
MKWNIKEKKIVEEKEEQPHVKVGRPLLASRSCS